MPMSSYKIQSPMLLAEPMPPVAQPGLVNQYCQFSGHPCEECLRDLGILVVDVDQAPNLALQLLLLPATWTSPDGLAQ